MPARRLPPSSLLLGVSAALLFGAPALAQNHLVAASCGQSTATIEDTSSDTTVSSVQALCSNGVPGTEGGGREISAFADSASGVIRASGVTDSFLSGNRRRGQARIQQRMSPDPGGSNPIVVRVDLQLSSSGGELARNLAELQLGDCITYVTYDLDDTPETTTGEIDCDDTGAVEWTTSAGPGLLSIEASYGLSPSSLLLTASVTGYLGNGTVDVADGEFFISGGLGVEQIGGNEPTFASPTFLTVPEPGGGALALTACAALAACTRRERT
jgi:hypothetical protein